MPFRFESAPFALDNSVQLLFPIFLYNFKPNHRESDEYSNPIWLDNDTNIFEAESDGLIDITKPLLISLLIGSQSFPYFVSVFVYVLCLVCTTIPCVKSNCVLKT